jgi:hypothetical protein
MAQCSRCGTETQLYDGGFPICIECDAAERKHQTFHRGDRLHVALRILSAIVTEKQPDQSDADRLRAMALTSEEYRMDLEALARTIVRRESKQPQSETRPEPMKVRTSGGAA